MTIPDISGQAERTDRLDEYVVSLPELLWKSEYIVKNNFLEIISIKNKPTEDSLNLGQLKREMKEVNYLRDIAKQAAPDSKFHAIKVTTRPDSKGNTRSLTLKQLNNEIQNNLKIARVQAVNNVRNEKGNITGHDSTMVREALKVLGVENRIIGDLLPVELENTPVKSEGFLKLIGDSLVDSRKLKSMAKDFVRYNGPASIFHSSRSEKFKEGIEGMVEVNKEILSVQKQVVEGIGLVKDPMNQLFIPWPSVTERQVSFSQANDEIQKNLKDARELAIETVKSMKKKGEIGDEDRTMIERILPVLGVKPEIVEKLLRVEVPFAVEKSAFLQSVADSLVESKYLADTAKNFLQNIQDVDGIYNANLSEKLKNQITGFDSINRTISDTEKPDEYSGSRYTDPVNEIRVGKLTLNKANQEIQKNLSSAKSQAIAAVETRKKIGNLSDTDSKKIRVALINLGCKESDIEALFPVKEPVAVDSSTSSSRKLTFPLLSFLAPVTAGRLRAVVNSSVAVAPLTGAADFIEDAIIEIDRDQLTLNSSVAVAPLTGAADFIEDAIIEIDRDQLTLNSSLAVDPSIEEEDSTEGDLVEGDQLTLEEREVQKRQGIEAVEARIRRGNLISSNHLELMKVRLRELGVDEDVIQKLLPPEVAALTVTPVDSDSGAVTPKVGVGPQSKEKELLTQAVFTLEEIQESQKFEREQVIAGVTELKNKGPISSQDSLALRELLKYWDVEQEVINDLLPLDEKVTFGTILADFLNTIS